MVAFFKKRSKKRLGKTKIKLRTTSMYNIDCTQYVDHIGTQKKIAQPAVDDPSPDPT